MPPLQAFLHLVGIKVDFYPQCFKNIGAAAPAAHGAVTVLGNFQAAAATINAAVVEILNVPLASRRAQVSTTGSSICTRRALDRMVRASRQFIHGLTVETQRGSQKSRTGPGWRCHP